MVKDFVTLLEEIPDGCAECLSFGLVVELKEEYFM